MSKKQLDKLAAQFDCRIYRIINSHGVMCQMAEETDTWLNLWNVGWYDTEKTAVDATIKHLQECIEMNIFSTNLFKYLEGLMIKDKPVTMTIKSVTNEEITSQRGKETKTTVHFAERDKALILNKTNAKQLIIFFGGETNDWIGKKITLYAEFGNWFGKEGWAVRVADKLPSQKKPAKPGSTVEDGALQTSIDEAEFVTAEQAEMLAVSDPGAFE